MRVMTSQGTTYEWDMPYEGAPQQQQQQVLPQVAGKQGLNRYLALAQQAMAR